MATNKNSTAKPIFANGRRIGSVEGITFRKSIRGSRHILKVPERSLAFSGETLNQAVRYGALYIEVTDLESSAVYLVSLEYFKANCYPVFFGEPQLALPCRLWIVTLPEAAPLGPEPAPAPIPAAHKIKHRPANRQMHLFDGECEHEPL